MTTHADSYVTRILIPSPSYRCGMQALRRDGTEPDAMEV
jgi:hypothetical protein